MENENIFSRQGWGELWYYLMGLSQIKQMNISHRLKGC